MHVSEVNRRKRWIGQLVKAEADMKMVEEAAELLGSEDYVPCARLLYEGAVVAYVRPYTADSKRRPGRPADLLPEDPQQRLLHDRLAALRNTLYAHSDETPHRVAVDPFGQHEYVEGSHWFNPAAMPSLAEMARSQRARFREERERLQDELRAAGVPPDPDF